MSDILSRSDLDAFVARLRATIAVAAEGQALRAAITQLVAGSTPALGSPPRSQRTARSAAPRKDAPPTRASAPNAPPATPTPTAKRRRPAGAVPADAVLAMLRTAPDGLAVRDVKAALGGGDETIRRRLHALERAGAVRRTGRLSTTRYHAA